MNIYWAVAYDFTAIGPFVDRKDHTRVVDLDPTDNVHTFTFALFQTRDEQARRRRGSAGKWTIDYGATVSHRRQDNDVPASYLPTETPVALDAAQVLANSRSHVGRRLAAIWSPSFRVELLEAALEAWPRCGGSRSLRGGAHDPAGEFAQAGGRRAGVPGAG